MIGRLTLLAALALVPVWGSAQGLMGDVLNGALVAPTPGAFAWYRLTDRASGANYFLRQAVTGKQKVSGKTGWWLETELVPPVGYPVVYKMLLTGPASDAKNVHEIIARRGDAPVEHIKVDEVPATEGLGADQPRVSRGKTKLTTLNGEIEAEHFVIGPEDQPDRQVEVWINESLPPMGIVRMTSPEGELVLQRHGVGGKDGESVLPGPQEKRKRRGE
jgi:hypothetical protein